MCTLNLKLLLVASVLVAASALPASGPDLHVRAQEARRPAPRVAWSMDADWRFSRGDFASAAMPSFNDASWRRLDLPHDWSAEGPFLAEYGSGNGYAPGGIAWYRRHLTVPSELSGRIATVEFDGVYDNAEVWINGQFVCGRPYGYTSFACQLTPHLR